MSVWRCRVCEGVNQGGRVCATCGVEVPRGEPLRAAVRTRLPSADPPAAAVPAPVPPMAPRTERRHLPTPEEMYVVNRDTMITDFGDFDIRPLPGGCLVSVAPRHHRRLYP